MTGFEVNFLRSHPLRDSTVTRYLNIYDIKSPHNEHVENFETGVRIQDLSLKSVQGVQDL